MIAAEQQREADAAFFEDWSAWGGLVIPFSVTRILEVRPCGGVAWDVAERLPGATLFRRHRYEQPRAIHVPAASWRALLSALPRIKAESDRYLTELQAREAAAMKRLSAGNASSHGADRVAAAITGERTLGGQIDAIGDALLLERDHGITKWERDFVVPIIERHAKYGDRIRLSAKQITVVAAIHDKIKHLLVC